MDPLTSPKINLFQSSRPNLLYIIKCNYYLPPKQWGVGAEFNGGMNTAVKYEIIVLLKR